MTISNILHLLGKNKWFVLITFTIIFLGYWIVIRPVLVRKECNGIALRSAIEKYNNLNLNYPGKNGSFLSNDYEFYYKQCIRKKGMN